MKGFCFMTETKAANNEEYRKQIERKNKLGDCETR